MLALSGNGYFNGENMKIKFIFGLMTCLLSTVVLSASQGASTGGVKASPPPSSRAAVPNIQKQMSPAAVPARSPAPAPAPVHR